MSSSRTLIFILCLFIEGSAIELSRATSLIDGGDACNASTPALLAGISASSKSLTLANRLGITAQTVYKWKKLSVGNPGGFKSDAQYPGYQRTRVECQRRGNIDPLGVHSRASEASSIA